jgi:sterol desaturase/sphingolipid hydroxylase (fatty acid hydroxylase superfamily)
MMLISLIVASAVIALMERIPQVQLRAQSFFRKFFVTDLFYLLTGFVAGGSVALAYVTRGSEFAGNVLFVPRITVLSLPSWVLVILALLALDVGNYLTHYCLHRFDVLWQFHKIHHSSRELDWLATFRSHIGEQILRRLLAPVLLILFGFPLNTVVIAGALFIAWSILNHANIHLNMQVLEAVFITPRLHRIHHLSNAPTRNLGTLFTLWDKLRGSLDLTTYGQECELGNGEPDYPQNWVRQFIRPLIAVQKTAVQTVQTK